jgi:hypothetical protein
VGGLAGSSSAQTQDGKTLPECSNKEGKLGDWGWTANTFGGWTVFTTAEPAGQSRYIDLKRRKSSGEPLPTAYLNRARGEWGMGVNLYVSQLPVSAEIAVLIRSASSSSRVTVSRQSFKRGYFPDDKVWHRSEYFEPATISQLGDPLQSNQIDIEVLDGNKPMFKFALHTSGFAEAKAKASAEADALKAMRDSKLCQDGPERSLDELFR